MVIEEDETRIKNVFLLNKSRFLWWNDQNSVKAKSEEQQVVLKR